MKYLASIESCTKRVQNAVRMLRSLEALKDNGFEYDIFNSDGPLYEDDDGKVIPHISFYESLIDDDIALMRKLFDITRDDVAHWKHKFNEIMCSKCFFPIDKEQEPNYAYCPSCGAKMAKEE